MITGEFDADGRPFVTCRVVVTRLGIDRTVPFLLDTGAHDTLLHPSDATKIEMPFGRLTNRVTAPGVGGAARYFQEPAVLVFLEESQVHMYSVPLLISGPDGSHWEMPSLLGRNVINHWRVDYDPSNGILGCVVRRADYSMDIN